MKRIVFMLILLLPLSGPAFAGWLADNTNLDFNLTAVPPHHEPVVGDRVARYRLQLEPQVDLDWLRYRGQINLWGVNTWRSPEQLGEQTWGNSDWSIEQVRVSLLHRVELGRREGVNLFTEYYLPLDRREWGRRGMESNYYWLVGVSGRFW